MIGKTLSHYKIREELGRGGMGVVYKAEDTTLHREVALKVLPIASLGSDDDKARFFREAQAAAQLHHANIATVFAIEEAQADDGSKQPFIAMEYIDGQTLTERISSGPLKLDVTVDIATQVASALELAHEKNIVHRDVKSGNVMLTSRGVAKVLDFGLAKTAQSTKLTQLGSTLGTIAYMSPEQARGEEVDRRSDIWSLGVLIYEMISGRLPFASEYEQAAVYSILNEDPEPLTAVRTGVPMALELLVGKCLTKNADQRYQSVTDLIVDLKSLEIRSKQLSKASGHMVQATPVQTDPVEAATTTSKNISMAIIGLVGLTLGALGMLLLKPDAPVEVRKFEIPTPGLTALAISHSGSQYAFVQNDTLYVRAFSSLTTRSLASTSASIIFWSPDDSKLGFAEEEKLFTVSASGGDRQLERSFESGTIHGATWTLDDKILVSTRTGSSLGQIHSVSSEGGNSTIVRQNDDEKDVASFDLLASLPSGGVTIYHARNSQGEEFVGRFADDQDLVLLKEDDFLPDGLALSPDGYLLVSDPSTGLTSYKLSSDKKSLSGVSKRLAPRGATAPTVSLNGTLAYIQNEPVDQIVSRFSESGERIATIGQSSRFLAGPLVNPDGNRVMVSRDQNSIWLMDTRGSATPLETGFNGYEIPTAWLPDGRRVIVSSFRDDIEIFALDITGRSKRQTLLTGNAWDASVSDDDRYMAFYSVTDQNRRDLFFVELIVTDDSISVLGDKQTYLSTPADEAVPDIHPDGDLLLYQSNVSGEWQIVVRTFPDPNKNFWTVTVDGGYRGRWHPSGKMIYYTTTDGMLWKIPFDKASSNPVGKPEPLFMVDTNVPDPYTIPFDFVPQTGEIVGVANVREPGPPSIVIVENWAAELK